jgi:hypothetical protein
VIRSVSIAGQDRPRPARAKLAPTWRDGGRERLVAESRGGQIGGRRKLLGCLDGFDGVDVDQREVDEAILLRKGDGDAVLAEGDTFGVTHLVGFAV